ncbi:MAG TPA: hypothetical protein VNR41_00355 [Xanthobacteraceae bacterium]|jgi:hypothetical protein|nr:hypothetical protein [Xanthobacteraceae bacterium]
MRKSLSIVLAASLISINPMSGAFAAPVAPIAPANDASALVLQIKSHRGGGGKHSAHRGGGNRGHANRAHNRRPHSGKKSGHHARPGKHHAKPGHHGKPGHHANKRHYKGYGRHHHHKWHYNGGRWVRPSDYWWIAGGAIAAGAAIGYLTYAQASAWAYDPPGQGYCWYYTDTLRTNGFWDACPVN